MTVVTFAWVIDDAKCIMVRAVCLSVCSSPHSTLLHGPGYNLGNGRGSPSCALLGGFAIGARVSFLWQHSANAKCQLVLVLALCLVLCMYWSCFGWVLFWCHLLLLEVWLPKWEFIVMATLRSRCKHSILPLWFLLLSFFFSLPILSRRRLDVYHIFTRCGLSANLECRSEMCCPRLAENAGCKNSPSAHHRTTLSGYIFAAKACIDNLEETC